VITATTNDVTTKKKEPSEESAEQQAATELVRLAREQGLTPGMANHRRIIHFGSNQSHPHAAANGVRRL
jgi:hypothetical protein